MMESLSQFLYMSGYGFYVWPAYGAVILFLLIQLLIPWRRWRKYLQKQNRL